MQTYTIVNNRVQGCLYGTNPENIVTNVVEVELCAYNFFSRSIFDNQKQSVVVRQENLGSLFLELVFNGAYSSGNTRYPEIHSLINSPLDFIAVSNRGRRASSMTFETGAGRTEGRWRLVWWVNPLLSPFLS